MRRGIKVDLEQCFITKGSERTFPNVGESYHKTINLTMEMRHLSHAECHKLVRTEN